MSLSIPDVTPHQIDRLVTELNTKGYACLPNYINNDDLRQMQEFVKAAIDKNNHEYIHFNGPDKVAGSGLEELARSSKFEKLIHDMYECGTGKTADHEEFYQVLRCLSGSTGKKNSLIFHYDSYIVTALVPIAIPTSGQAGDLLMYPNTRNVRNTYAANVIDKVLLDNPVTQHILRACIDSKRLSPIRIKMLPGHLYFFWGYRSIHTNEPCDPDKIRATALFHYKNPHRKSTA